MGGRRLVALFGLIAACGDGPAARPATDAGTRMDAAPADGQRGVDAAPDAAVARRCTAGAGATTFDVATLDQIVVVADARAATPGRPSAWPSLLVTALPIGLDRFIDMLRLERAGASFASLAEAPELLCACAGGECRSSPGSCLNSRGDTGSKLVIVQLGTVDMLQVFLRLAQQPSLAADPMLLADFRAQVRAVLAMVDDRELFARRPALRVVGLVDPSDGSGDLDALVQRVFNLPIATHVPPADALRVLAAMNMVLAEEAGACGGAFVDAGLAFLGHGLFFDDAANPHHSATDATPWLNGLYGVSARGAWELARLIGAAIGAADPGMRPVFTDPPAMLPMVPADGWAKSVVESHVTQMIMSDFGAAQNAATDPTKALGAPTAGNVDAVALGVLGADVVLDLGAGTAASDGAGDDVVVREQGPMSQGIGEPYRVLGADAPGGPWQVIGDGYGEQAFDLGGMRARYVRVISLATLGDVVRGPGSPFYPGPEIDAVGAVYPR